MAKKYDDDCGGLKPIVHPEIKKPKPAAKKTAVKKTVKAAATPKKK